MSVGIGVALIRLHDLPVEIPMREDADILRAVGERLHGVDRLRRNDDRLTGAEFHGFSGTDLDANPSDHRHRRMVVVMCVPAERFTDTFQYDRAYANRADHAYRGLDHSYSPLFTAVPRRRNP